MKPAVFGLLILLAAAAQGLPVAPLSATEAAALTELGMEAVQGAPHLLDFTLNDLNGKTVRLGSLRGKVILVNFWATWCPPCRAEMPAMEKLYQTLKNNPDFVLLAIDSQEDPATAKAFIQKNAYHFPVLLDPNGAVTNQYSVRAYPTTYLIDKQGRVAGGIVGAMAWEAPATRQGLQKLLQLH